MRQAVGRLTPRASANRTEETPLSACKIPSDEGCPLKGTIPRRRQAVFGSGGRDTVLHRNCDDPSGPLPEMKHRLTRWKTDRRKASANKAGDHVRPPPD